MRFLIISYGHAVRWWPPVPIFNYIRSTVGQNRRQIPRHLTLRQWTMSLVSLRVIVLIAVVLPEHRLLIDISRQMMFINWWYARREVGEAGDIVQIPLRQLWKTGYIIDLIIFLREHRCAWWIVLGHFGWIIIITYRKQINLIIYLFAVTRPDPPSRLCQPPLGYLHWFSVPYFKPRINRDLLPIYVAGGWNGWHLRFIFDYLGGVLVVLIPLP